jgi:hypothetical protein
MNQWPPYDFDLTTQVKHNHAQPPDTCFRETCCYDLLTVQLLNEVYDTHYMATTLYIS